MPCHQDTPSRNYFIQRTVSLSGSSINSLGRCGSRRPVMRSEWAAAARLSVGAARGHRRRRWRRAVAAVPGSAQGDQRQASLSCGLRRGTLERAPPACGECRAGRAGRSTLRHGSSARHAWVLPPTARGAPLPRVGAPAGRTGSSAPGRAWGLARRRPRGEVRPPPWELTVGGRRGTRGRQR